MASSRRVVRSALTGLAGLAVLAGCATPSVDPQALDRLAPGRTTLAEAVAALGTPDRDDLLADGGRILVYRATRLTPRAVNAVPVAAQVWGGWDGDSAEAALLFDEAGLLRLTTWTAKDQRPTRVVGPSRP